MVFYGTIAVLLQTSVSFLRVCVCADDAVYVVKFTINTVVVYGTLSQITYINGT